MIPKIDDTVVTLRKVNNNYSLLQAGSRGVVTETTDITCKAYFSRHPSFRGDVRFEDVEVECNECYQAASNRLGGVALCKSCYKEISK